MACIYIFFALVPHCRGVCLCRVLHPALLVRISLWSCTAILPSTLCCHVYFPPVQTLSVKPALAFFSHPNFSLPLNLASPTSVRIALQAKDICPLTASPFSCCFSLIAATPITNSPITSLPTFVIRWRRLVNRHHKCIFMTCSCFAFFGHRPTVWAMQLQLDGLLRSRFWILVVKESLRFTRFEKFSVI